MEKLVDDKICLVTGATRGIGRAIAEVLLDHGAIVYANERTEGAVEKWAVDLPDEKQSRLHPLTFDVSDEPAVRDALSNLRRSEGRLDVLVNNAGIEENGLIGMTSHESMRRMLDVNVLGVFNTMQAASRMMRRQEQGGSMVNIASLSGMNGNAGQFGYSATKGAVLAMTKSAAKELAPCGIRVNAIAPGLTDTDMFRATPHENLENRLDRIMFGRVAQPTEIANACLFLASDLSEYVSGQVLAVDGCTLS